MQLENKVAAIIGASSGIGRAITLAGEGAAVAVGYRGHPEEAEAYDPARGEPVRVRDKGPQRTEHGQPLRRGWAGT